MGQTKDLQRVMASVCLYMDTDTKTGEVKFDENGDPRGYAVARPDVPGVDTSVRVPFSKTQGSMEQAVKSVLRQSGSLSEAASAERRKLRA